MAQYAGKPVGVIVRSAEELGRALEAQPFKQAAPNRAVIVFLDTPGIHKPKHKLGEYMVKAAEGTLKEVDAIFFVVDATEKMGPGEYYILERLQATAKPVILVVNKLDLIEKEQVLPIISHYTDK